ncbi:MAG TPA: hypothetical protein VGP57_08345 [Actinoplanes sp.]|jgi:hypothetical protein|nr:hypothetical protein [Actinoplanes sp.]
MADVRHLTLEAALDDWISDYEMQGDYESECGLEPPAAYAEMVRQAIGWISRGVLVPGQMLAEGFVPWPDSPHANGRRFAELATGLTAIELPGDICWFDLGPAGDDELKQLSANDECSRVVG